MHPARTRWGRLAIGLTGGIGSGKSTVSALFAAKGVTLIDTDRIAHALTASGGAAMPLIAQRFGAEFVQADGALDRARMRARVFAEAAEKQALEAILHPLIGQECERQALAAQSPYLIFDVPLLVESGHWLHKVERVLVVDCPTESQIQRVMSRNGFTRQQVEDIIAVQASREQRLAVADDVLDNQGGLSELENAVNQLHQTYLALA